MAISSKKCLICKKHNDTIHAHSDPETNEVWLWCCGCGRGYGLRTYCHLAGISLSEFLKLDFDFIEAKPNEINKIDWPAHFVPMSDPRAKKGVDYVTSRGIELKGDFYFDTEREGIVFPMYFHGVFAGGQVRLIKPWEKDGNTVKMLTMPGTRSGLLLYNHNQSAFITDVKGVIVTEGAFNCLAIQQSLDKLYGGVVKNPWKVMSTSGCGVTNHQLDVFKGFKEAGIKVVAALDSDEPGMKGLAKLSKAEVITHYALTSDPSIDWNDEMMERGAEFAKYFLSLITSVQKL